MSVNQIDYVQAVERIVQLGKKKLGSYICAANVHMLLEAWDDTEFRETINAADIVTPDGMPLVWMMRLKGVKGQSRVYGPTLMLHVLDRAAKEGIPVGFYGSEQATLVSLVERMRERFVGLKVVYAYSPPFRALTEEEDARIGAEIAKSGTRILFVGLGCPRQEIWMCNHRGRLKVTMLGVGAAFDFLSGNKKQAPVWVQRIGLEWLFRFVLEPKRLARRYLYHNPRFIVLALADLLGLIKPSNML
jgi:N-acetylglucosaminyldiphosphoundecaprenol N-acetyl-beta-D-mannosaminyltransferase